ncbi:alpha/beta hydrolase family protein [Enterovibrio coralii]|uniref:AB hydrolase-1 domain-containing protein n=1 Tax=Enterovibrio coralii TaxID=294935 RepID=A0A135I8T1_9GAMM|nr:alpha/beta fold hydrolase [Enterovibrio coralii]KXF81827.1 hypothetical protein ATN88_20210 [Enterovibrio coralii]
MFDRIQKHALISTVLLAFSFGVVAEEIVMVPVSLDGETVQLEMLIYKPDAIEKPRPTLVLNHGSTGYGNDPSLFTAKVDYFHPIIDHFIARDWVVIAPMRRGRGGSEGLYDEGFDEARTSYTCETDLSLKGAYRGLDDIHASVEAISTMPFVDKDRLVISGVSRGGILSTAYAGIYPDDVKGVINFVGGWISDWCSTADDINGALFRDGGKAKVSSIWLYGENDSFYSMAHSRNNFDTYVSAGGDGEFHTIELDDEINGHFVNMYSNTWTKLVDEYLKQIDVE